MKKCISFFLTLTLLLASQVPVLAQQYQPNWESLDKRPMPEWYKNVKFGIFIHWGVYSVPGWSSKGQYAEWYQQGLQTSDTARQRFHKAKFGNRSYYDLANDFKAELFKPDEWASVFEKSGAKYIVLTSKHHDGFTLWPSKEADASWGFKWNAVDVGPKRDLIGDLFKAVRKTSVHAGMYYSLYEWFNPLWKKDPKQFAAQHTWPQMKDLINNYQPDVFWTDGDWDASAETWKSQEFLAWLYNESPVKDRVVVNDRWGSGMRFKHGGIYTPEYQPDLDFEDHYWEESRGMGFSYGYNREEDSWDYNSTQSLVLQLIDKVSRGGNFLLDIGPDEHGKIPPIMEERLLQMGEWLKINGNAIYNTVRWRRPSQWSDGRTDYKPAHGGGDLLLKLTVDPEPGYAVKEVFFTYNEKENDLYAILPRYPDNRQLLLKDIQLPSGTAISFLSTNESLQWKQVGENVVVTMPEYNPNKIKSPYAYAIKIKGYGKFAAKPVITANTINTNDIKQVVTITGEPGAVIRYTLDGTAPDANSLVYAAPIVVATTTTVSARVYPANGAASGIASQKVVLYTPKKAIAVKAVKPGLTYQAYELKPTSTKELQSLSPVKSGVTETVSIAALTRQENVGLVLSGFLKVDNDALYKFYLSSDDGSRLFIDDEEVIDFDGLHGADVKEGGASLKKGFHTIRVEFIQATGGIDLQLKYSVGGSEKQSVPATALFHN